MGHALASNLMGGGGYSGFIGLRVRTLVQLLHIRRSESQKSRKKIEVFYGRLTYYYAKVRRWYLSEPLALAV